jgi:hypothetical protein
MQRFSGPGWRLAGLVGSWLLFSFCFVLIYLSSFVVMLLGGSCASGGPYVIGVECPTIVLYTFPWAIFGALAAVVLGVVFAKGFGLPVVAWAWPIGIGGLGIGSFLGGVLTGGFWYFVGAAMFLLFAIPVLVYEIRLSPLRLFLGATDIHDQGFVVRTGRLHRMFRRGKPDIPQVVEATPLHAIIAIVPGLIGAAAGGWLAWLAYVASASSAATS